MNEPMANGEHECCRREADEKRKRNRDDERNIRIRVRSGSDGNTLNGHQSDESGHLSMRQQRHLP